MLESDIIAWFATVDADGAAGEWLAKYADAYAAKYAGALGAFGMRADAITQKYSTALVLTPEKILAWRPRAPRD